MAKLMSKERNALPKAEFALPSQRKYPVNDASHARNAKARASEMEHKGRISESTKESIDRKADAVLGHGDRGHKNVTNSGSHGEKMRHI